MKNPSFSQILAILGALDRCDREKAATYVASLQQPDGSFWGDEWGEVDTRFSYCALASLSVLGRLRGPDPADVDVEACAEVKDRSRRRRGYNVDGSWTLWSG